MKQPGFWYPPDGRPGWQARLLSPVAAFAAAATARRVNRGPGYAAQVPVLCIGNINVGGTGKTPTVIALCQMLADQGHRAKVVSRGYGGKLDGPVLVDPRCHKASDVGDEPLLISAFAPVIVAKDREAGVRMAERDGCDIILLDDGFQSPAVRRNASVIVVDAARGFGNGMVMPAGPLRERIEAGMARADLLLSIGPTAAQLRFEQIWGGAVSIPRVSGHLDVLEMGMPWAGLRVLAFAGIGHPDKFFDTLRTAGAEIIRAEALSDHQPLTPALLARLEADAMAAAAQLVTTEKDAVRLPDTFRQKVLTLPVRLRFDDPAPIMALVNRLLNSTSAP